MEPPPIPPDEPERLEALRTYDVLNSEPEAAYDETTALAALISEAPFSLITLVAEDRQWFKSRHGWHSKESDRVPRELTPDQEQALRVLGTHVMTLLELRRSKRRRDVSDEIINSLPWDVPSWTWFTRTTWSGVARS